eukprot:14503505-Heterocapsa_arctica.AAC.1
MCRSTLGEVLRNMPTCATGLRAMRSEGLNISDTVHEPRLALPGGAVPGHAVLPALAVRALRHVARPRRRRLEE